jgi:hypothetical protein
MSVHAQLCPDDLSPQFLLRVMSSLQIPLCNKEVYRSQTIPPERRSVYGAGVSRNEGCQQAACCGYDRNITARIGDVVALGRIARVSIIISII